MTNTGKWAFIIGLILAVLSGFFGVPYLALVLLVLGLIVGFLNISTKEEQLYLIAVVALLAVGIGSVQALSILNVDVSNWVNTVLANFIVFVAASGLIVAVKAIIKSGRES